MQNLKLIVGAHSYQSRVELDGVLLTRVSDVVVQTNRGQTEILLTMCQHDLDQPVVELDGMLYSHEEHQKLQEIFAILGDYAQRLDDPAFQGLLALIRSFQGERTLVSTAAPQRISDD